MFFKKITTYDKIKFPQQANRMVGGTSRNCAYNNFFWQIKPKIILILIQPHEYSTTLYLSSICTCPWVVFNYIVFIIYICICPWVVFNYIVFIIYMYLSMGSIQLHCIYHLYVLVHG